MGAQTTKPLVGNRHSPMFGLDFFQQMMQSVNWNPPPTCYTTPLATSASFSSESHFGLCDHLSLSLSPFLSCGFLSSVPLSSQITRSLPILSYPNPSTSLTSLASPIHSFVPPSYIHSLPHPFLPLPDMNVAHQIRSASNEEEKL